MTDLESTLPSSASSSTSTSSTPTMTGKDTDIIEESTVDADSNIISTPSAQVRSTTPIISPASPQVTPSLVTKTPVSTKIIETDYPHFSPSSPSTKPKSITPPPLPPAIISDSPEPIFTSPALSSPSSSEEGEEVVQEILIKPTDLKDLNPSPLFPSPSSTFIPPPKFNDEENDIVNNLDKRIMIEKEKRDSGKDELLVENENDDEGEEEIIYDVTPTPLSPLFPAHPALHPDPNLPPLDLNRSSSLESTPGYFTPTTLSSSTFTSSNPTSLPSSFVFIRDFAFEKEDPRFTGGRHPDQDLKNRYNDEDQEEAEGRVSPKVGNEEFSTSGSSGFSWGFVTSHQTDFQSEDESQNASEIDEDDSTSIHNNNHRSNNGTSFSNNESIEEQEGKFIAGTYQALYDFIPESGTEMKLVAGEIIVVYSRQCVGWVQAEKLDPSTGVSDDMGLVPENYLALLEADLSLSTPNEEEDDEEWEEEEEEEDEEDEENREGGDEREIDVEDDNDDTEEEGDQDTEEEKDIEKVSKEEILEEVATPKPSTSIEIQDLVEPVVSEESPLVTAVIA